MRASTYSNPKKGFLITAYFSMIVALNVLVFKSPHHKQNTKEGKDSHIGVILTVEDGSIQDSACLSNIRLLSYTGTQNVSCCHGYKKFESPSRGSVQHVHVGWTCKHLHLKYA
jgi:hypothetical protein